jgi:hypothetical protein
MTSASPLATSSAASSSSSLPIPSALTATSTVGDVAVHHVGTVLHSCFAPRPFISAEIQDFLDHFQTKRSTLDADELADCRRRVEATVASAPPNPSVAELVALTNALDQIALSLDNVLPFPPGAKVGANTVANAATATPAAAASSN